MRMLGWSLALYVSSFATLAFAADKPIPPLPRQGTWTVLERPGDLVQVTRTDDRWVMLQYGAGGLGEAGREKDAFLGVFREPPDRGDHMRLVRFTAIAGNTLRAEIRDGWDAADVRVETWAPLRGDTALFVGVAPPPGATGEDREPKFGEYVYVEELPEVLQKVAPKYPEEARRAGVEGTVVVQALIGRNGRVKDTRIVNSIPLLDDAAVTAVRQWEFDPAKSKGKPVAVWVAVPVKFSLK